MSLRADLQLIREHIRMRGETEDGYVRYYKEVHDSDRGRRYYYDDQAELVKLIARVLKGE